MALKITQILSSWTSEQCRVVYFEKLNILKRIVGRFAFKSITYYRPNRAMDTFVDDAGFINFLIDNTFWLRIAAEDFFELSDILKNKITLKKD